MFGFQQRQFFEVAQTDRETGGSEVLSVSDFSPEAIKAGSEQPSCLMAQRFPS